MNPQFHARWITKQQTQHLKKTGKLKEALVLDSCKGPILVDYEVRNAWCLGPKAQIQRARQLLGLALDPT